MARRTITNNQLFHIEQDIERFGKEWPGMYFLLQTKIQGFLDDSLLHRRAFHDKLHSIQKKFIEHDELDKPIYADDEKTEWKFKGAVAGKDGILITGAAVKEAYEAEATEFFQRSVTVNF